MSLSCFDSNLHDAWRPRASTLNISSISINLSREKHTYSIYKIASTIIISGTGVSAAYDLRIFIIECYWAPFSSCSCRKFCSAVPFSICTCSSSERNFLDVTFEESYRILENASVGSVALFKCRNISTVMYRATYNKCRCSRKIQRKYLHKSLLIMLYQ